MCRWRKFTLTPNPSPRRGEGWGEGGDIHNLLATNIAAALDWQLPERGEPADLLCDYLHDREMLLVLDNFEHLLAGAGFILELLQRAPRLTILVTSRAVLDLQAERVLPLAGLPSPPEGANLQARTYPCIELFVERAGRGRRAFVPDDRNLTAAAQICRFVEGIPLAIELAAGWTVQLALPEIVTEMQRSLDFLTTTRRDVPERQRSMRAVCESSWALLTDVEQRTLAQLAVFRGGFAREAARAVSMATPENLQSLARKSLVRRTAPHRYDLHELIRQFAAGKLDEIEKRDSEKVRERHSAYYLDFVAREARRLYGADSRHALAELRRELANVRQAWRWAAEQARLDLLGRSLEGMANFLQMAGLIHEGQAAFQKAAARVRGMASADETARRSVLGHLLAERANFLNSGARYEQAAELAREAVELTENLAEAYLQWGSALYRQGQYEAAQEKLQAILQLDRAAVSERMQANALRHLGNVYFFQGELVRAKEYFERAVPRYRAIGDRYFEGQTLNGLGAVSFNLGEFRRAKECLTQFAQICREFGNEPAESGALNNLAMFATLMGDYARGKEYLERSVQLSHKNGNRDGEIRGLYNLGWIFYYLGDHEAALEYCERSLRLAEGVGDKSNLDRIWRNLGHVLLALGRLDEAENAYQQVVDIQRELQQGNMVAEGLAGLARVALVQDDTAAAQGYVAEILQRQADNTWEGMDEPALVYLTCYRALGTTQDTRAAEVLKNTYAELQKRAAAIDDAEMRRSFVENVAAHREIVREYENVKREA